MKSAHNYDIIYKGILELAKASDLIDNIDILNGNYNITADGDAYTVKGDFTVPTTIYSASVSWTSSSDSLTISDGTVSPALYTDESVTLTATVTYGSTVATKTYALNIKTVADPSGIYYNDDFSGIDRGTLVNLGSITNTNYDGYIFSLAYGRGSDVSQVSISSAADSAKGNIITFYANKYNGDDDRRLPTMTLTNTTYAKMQNDMYISFDVKFNNTYCSLRLSDGADNTISVSTALSENMQTSVWYNIAIITYSGSDGSEILITDADGNYIDDIKSDTALTNLIKISAIGANRINESIDNLKVMDISVPEIVAEDITKTAMGLTSKIASVSNADSVDIALSNDTDFSYSYDESSGAVSITAANTEEEKSTTVTITAHGTVDIIKTFTVTSESQQSFADEVIDEIDIADGNDSVIKNADGTYAVYGSFVMPAAVKQIPVTWTSSDTETVSVSGGNASVTLNGKTGIILTASVTAGNVAAEREFILNVSDTAGVINAIDLVGDNTTVSVDNNVYTVSGDFSLPVKIGDVSVEWTSSSDAVSISDGTAAVNRDMLGDVTLTAKVSIDGKTYSKEFALTLIPSSGLSEDSTIAEYSTAADNPCILITEVKDNGNHTRIKGLRYGKEVEYIADMSSKLYKMDTDWVFPSKECYSGTLLWSSASGERLANCLSPGDVIGVSANGITAGIMIKMLDVKELAKYAVTGSGEQFIGTNSASASRDGICIGEMKEVVAEDDDYTYITVGYITKHINKDYVADYVDITTDENGAASIDVKTDSMSPSDIETYDSDTNTGAYVFMRNFSNGDSRETVAYRFNMDYDPEPAKIKQELPFEITNVNLKNTSGEIITSTPKDEDFTVGVTVYGNNSDAMADYTAGGECVFAAVYGTDGKLLRLDYAKMSIPFGYETEFEFYIPAVTAEVGSVKAFVWNGFDGAIPLAEAKYSTEF